MLCEASSVPLISRYARPTPFPPAPLHVLVMSTENGHEVLAKDVLSHQVDARAHRFRAACISIDSLRLADQRHPAQNDM